MNQETEKRRIEEFFKNFKIDIDCKDLIINDNSITYVIDLKCKTRVSTIKSYKQELMLKFDAIDVEFELSINKTPYLGISIIKERNCILMLNDLIQSKEFINAKQKISIIIGRDLYGNNVVEDLVQLPHLLIAGTTGTGKSNLIRTFIIDIIYKLEPSEVKFVLIDTRKTNFKQVNILPYLLVPVIEESKEAMGILNYLINEMNSRYELFSDIKVDDIDDYNKISDNKLPRIVVIIEDFYDLVMDTNGEVNFSIQRLMQMSRAAGMNIVISTQRPSTNVITGTIKANMPSRIAFKVPSQVDSKTMIDVSGAEKLFGLGDILFKKEGELRIKRIQTPYISDSDMKNIIDNVIRSKNVDYDEYLKNEQNKDIMLSKISEESKVDSLMIDVVNFVIETGQASTSAIQRNFKVKYLEAAKIIDKLEEMGVISAYLGSKPRNVLISIEDWNKQLNNMKDKNDI